MTFFFKSKGVFRSKNKQRNKLNNVSYKADDDQVKKLKPKRKKASII